MLPNTSDPQTDYGLPYDDYDPNGVVNPRTEQSASFAENSLVDIAALTMVAPRAHVHVLNANVAIINWHSAVWGDTDAVKPTISRTSAGVVVLTWALSGGYPDLNPTPARKVYRTASFHWAQVTPNQERDNLTDCIHARVEITSNSATVYTFNNSGVALDCDFFLTVG